MLLMHLVFYGLVYGMFRLREKLAERHTRRARDAADEEEHRLLL